MTPEFAAAIDPIFLKVLGAWEKIGLHVDLEPSALQNQLLASIREADDRLRSSEQAEAWNLARFAICAWIDDLMITRRWSGQKWWENHKLEYHFFKTTESATLFFQKAEEAQGIANRDAIEVYYVTVILGFRGLYADQDSSSDAMALGFPPKIEDWCKRVASMLNVRPIRPSLEGPSRECMGAPALEGKLTLVGTLVCMLMLTIVACVISFYVFFKNA